MKLKPQLYGLNRCPHCNVAAPRIGAVWGPKPIKGFGDWLGSQWGLYQCGSCGQLILAQGQPGETENESHVSQLYPEAKSAPEELPGSAKRYLQQAFESLHAPDAAVLMAASAVDAMLKSKGYTEGSLYNRIDQAVAAHVLTEDMGTWAHAVRLEANRPRHADAEAPHVTPGEAQQSVEFADALGHFLFVLSHRIKTGLAAAESAGAVEKKESQPAG